MKLPPIPKHIWALDDTWVFYLSLSVMFKDDYF